MSKKVQLKTITAPKIRVADFHGDKVEGVRIVVGGKPKVYVLLKRLCENLGVQFRSQIKKIPSWIEEFGESTVTKMVTVAEDGKKREQLAIDLDFLPVFLMSIKTKKVKPELREKLRAYKREAKEVLARYFIDGEEASQESKELLRTASDQATILPDQIAEFKSILDELKRKEQEAEEYRKTAIAKKLLYEEVKTWAVALEGYARLCPEATPWCQKMYKKHVIERLNGEAVLTPVRITIKEFLAMKGYKNPTRGELGMMGRYAKQEYIKAKGREPFRAISLINNGTKEVVVYFYEYPTDQEILERAFVKFSQWREQHLKKIGKEVSRA